MKKTLIVIVMQNDFVTDVLGTPEAAAILPKVKKKIQAARAAGQEIIFTRDTHGANYAATQEGKRLPVPHCIQGTRGWELVPGLWEEGERIIDKPTSATPAGANSPWKRWSSSGFAPTFAWYPTLCS